MIGMAISSARNRSCSIVRADLTEHLGEAADADGGAVDGLAGPLGQRLDAVTDLIVVTGALRATTRARLLSSLRSGGGDPSDQYDTTSSTPGSAGAAR